MLIDEIDPVSDKRGGEDYGFFTELDKILDKSKQPIIIIANDPYENKNYDQFLKNVKNKV